MMVTWDSRNSASNVRIRPVLSLKISGTILLLPLCLHDVTVTFTFNGVHFSRKERAETRVKRPLLSPIFN